MVFKLTSNTASISVRGRAFYKNAIGEKISGRKENKNGERRKKTTARKLTHWFVLLVSKY